MFKNEKLEILFQHACEKELCNNKKTFAELIGVSSSNISKIFADKNERFCTTNTLLKANAALDNVFSVQWLLSDTGDMYATSNTDTTPLSSTPVTEGFSDVDYRMRCAELERVIEALKGTIESQKGTIKSQERIIEMLERENESIKKARTHVS